MSKVFVIDTNKQPLNPVHPGKARMLLNEGKAAVWKRYPFTIILKVAITQPEVQDLRIKIDPGSKITGMALVNDASGAVVFAAELTHRGQTIKKALDDRRNVRRSRRRRNTRYRKPRYLNRKRRSGWLPPSLESRIANVVTWVQRLRRLAPITAVSQELVRFDLQQMENPKIAGKEYQQGPLAGYEVREYLLEKWQRKCAYCGTENTPLQVEHIQPRSDGGTDRISNLCLACEPCNRAKGSKDIREFLAKKPAVLERILSQVKAPLKDAAAVNATQWVLYRRLQALGLPIEVGSGGLTKFNRVTRKLPKTHWLDAVCVGKSTPKQVKTAGIIPLLITAKGHGCRQKCNVDECGFPCSKPKGAKKIKGFQTGDIVRAVVTKGKRQGRYVGKVMVRANGSFDIQTTHRRVKDIGYCYCQPLHKSDGYRYQQGMARFSWEKV